MSVAHYGGKPGEGDMVGSITVSCMVRIGETHRDKEPRLKESTTTDPARAMQRIQRTWRDNGHGQRQHRTTEMPMPLEMVTSSSRATVFPCEVESSSVPPVGTDESVQLHPGHVR